MATTTVSNSKSILFERRDQIVLLVHSADPPNNADWDEYVQALAKAARNGATGLLVLTDGVGPDSTQRKMISDIKLRTAVVTLSRMARGIVTALGWLGANIRAFAPDQMDEALDSLGVPAADREAVSRRLAAMRLEVAGKSAAAMAVAEIQEVLNSSLATLAQR